MIAPGNGAEALYVNTLAAHRVRAVRAAEIRVAQERPWKKHDQAFRDVVSLVGPVFKDRDAGLVEWAEMLAREVLAGNPVPAVDRLLEPVAEDNTTEPVGSTVSVDGVDEVVDESGGDWVIEVELEDPTEDTVVEETVVEEKPKRGSRKKAGK